MVQREQPLGKRRGRGEAGAQPSSRPAKKSCPDTRCLPGPPTPAPIAEEPPCETQSRGQENLSLNGPGAYGHSFSSNWSVLSPRDNAQDRSCHDARHEQRVSESQEHSRDTMSAASGFVSLETSGRNRRVHCWHALSTLRAQPGSGSQRAVTRGCGLGVPCTRQYPEACPSLQTHKTTQQCPRKWTRRGSVVGGGALRQGLMGCVCERMCKYDVQLGWEEPTRHHRQDWVS